MVMVVVLMMYRAYPFTPSSPQSGVPWPLPGVWAARASQPWGAAAVACNGVAGASKLDPVRTSLATIESLALHLVQGCLGTGERCDGGDCESRWRTLLLRARSIGLVRLNLAAGKFSIHMPSRRRALPRYIARHMDDSLRQWRWGAPSRNGGPDNKRPGCPPSPKSAHPYGVRGILARRALLQGPMHTLGQPAAFTAADRQHAST